MVKMTSANSYRKAMKKGKKDEDRIYIKSNIVSSGANGKSQCQEHVYNSGTSNKRPKLLL